MKLIDGQKTVILLDASSNSIAVSWPETCGAIRYVLQYRRATTSDRDEDEYQTLSEQLTTTEARKNNLVDSDGIGFIFRVGAVVSEWEGVKPWITHAEPFHILTKMEESKRMEAPTVDSQGGGHSAVVSWRDAVFSIRGYELQMRKNDGGEAWDTIAPCLLGTEARKKNLHFRKGYQFRVRPVVTSSETTKKLPFSPPCEPFVAESIRTAPSSCTPCITYNGSPTQTLKGSSHTTPTSLTNYTSDGSSTSSGTSNSTSNEPRNSSCNSRRMPARDSSSHSTRTPAKDTSCASSSNTTARDTTAGSSCLTPKRDNSGANSGRKPARETPGGNSGGRPSGGSSSKPSGSPPARVPLGGASSGPSAGPSRGPAGGPSRRLSRGPTPGPSSSGILDVFKPLENGTFLRKEDKGTFFRKAKESPISVTKALRGKEFVLLYASAHWCPQCRKFTPILAKWYKEQGNDRNRPVEVVFLSADQDVKGFRKYYAGMPWLAVKFDDDGLEELMNKFGVSGIPRLVVLHGRTGRILDDKAIVRPLDVNRWRTLSAANKPFSI